MAEPLLRVENLVLPVRRRGRDRQRLARCRQRRTARHHRPERRRQDHADQPAHRAVDAAFRHHPLCRPGHHRGCRPIAAAGSGWRARSRSPRCCPTSPPPTMSRWRRRRMTGTPSGSGAMPARKSACATRRSSALARVGLDRRADTVVSELSHGEQRELELAVALATKPQLLLLDEPMAGLGATESARMVKLLQELRREVTIVLVEHDMDGGVRARRPHHRAGLWPRHRLRRAGGDPQQRRGQARLSRRSACGDPP